MRKSCLSLEVKFNIKRSASNPCYDLTLNEDFPGAAYRAGSKSPAESSARHSCPNPPSPSSVLLRTPRPTTSMAHRTQPTTHKYGTNHALQTLDIYLPRPLSESPTSKTIWVVFLHGGAWVDPAQDKTELRPAIDILLGHEKRIERIAGFASINYGLSPRPGYEDESEGDKSRSARHPQHLQDVQKALRWLKRVYNVGGAGNNGEYDWIIVGHSCGATMAFQLAMKLLPLHDDSDAGFGPAIRKPLALVGLAGLYNLPALIHNHSDEPYYRAFVASAFGDDEKVWVEASPVNGDPETILRGLRAVIIGQSLDDGLVEMEQGRVMSEKLNDWQNAASVIEVRLEGTHDEIWQGGVGVVRGIEPVIERLFENQAAVGSASIREH
jgi:kynurenine formamidase